MKATWSLDDRVVRRRVCACGEMERTVEIRPQTKDMEPLMAAVGIIQTRMQEMDLMAKKMVKLPWKGPGWKSQE